VDVSELGEFPLIERLIERLGSGRGVVLGAGDDAAALMPTPGMLIVATCDSQVEDRHFRRDRITPEQLGRRLAAVNLSDIAAMGGDPRWALVSLALPPATPATFVESVYVGLSAELQHFGAAVVGGNVAASEMLLFDLTLLGEVRPDQMLSRGGARAGDTILVTGTLGASAAGRAALDAGLDLQRAGSVINAHLTPEPRVLAGGAIAASGLATAAIDVSDGFAQDLGHICDASSAGALVEAARLPISEDTRAVARTLGLDPIELALSGGEDYELICTADPAAAAELIARVRDATRLELTAVGRILPAGAGHWIELPNGIRAPLAGGWQHFESSSN
jgi:thiamine-monophosphate kinase